MKAPERKSAADAPDRNASTGAQAEENIQYRTEPERIVTDYHPEFPPLYNPFIDDPDDDRGK